MIAWQYTMIHELISSYVIAHNTKMWFSGSLQGLALMTDIDLYDTHMWTLVLVDRVLIN